MHRFLLIASVLSMSLCARAQPVSFEPVSANEFPQPYPAPAGRAFEGVSALEYMPSFPWMRPGKKRNAHVLLLDSARRMPDSAAMPGLVNTYGRNSGKHHFFAATDHDTRGRSWLFSLDDSLRPVTIDPCGEVRDIEAIRYHVATQMLAYAYEAKRTTGVQVRRAGPAGSGWTTIVEEAIPSAHTSDNRGIEALCFTADSSLWMAYESGGGTRCGDSVLPFRRYRYDAQAQRYDSARYEEYAYPFDRCSCLEKGKINGSRGNGVTELLHVPGMPGTLLVLERCFDGKTGHSALWLATVHPGTRVLTKERVFDFTGCCDSMTVNNLEAMSWGPAARGRPVLYLMTDNNNGGNGLHTQTLKLRMKRRKPAPGGNAQPSE